MYWIEYYDSSNLEKGYNCTFGGKSEIPNKETRKKLSNALKGKPKSEEHKKHLWDNRSHEVSEETRKKLSDAAKRRAATGHYFSEETLNKMKKSKTKKIKVKKKKNTIQISNFKGKHHTEETKQKISNTLKNKHLTLSEEHKQKLIDACTGRIKSEEEIRKIKEAKLGKKWTIEQKKSKWKLPDEKVIEIIKCLKNNESINSIAKKYNVSRNVIYGIKDNRTYLHISRD